MIPWQTESRSFYDCCLKMIGTYARHQSRLRVAASDSSAEEDSFSDLLLLMELLTNMLTKDIIDLGGHDGEPAGRAASLQLEAAKFVTFSSGTRQTGGT